MIFRVFNGISRFFLWFSKEFSIGCSIVFFPLVLRTSGDFLIALGLTSKGTFWGDDVFFSSRVSGRQL